jgi:N-acetylglucosaminyldiphosphoundecaprenol N-acetyl-beta-D-mannosaminyltransferase
VSAPSDQFPTVDILGVRIANLGIEQFLDVLHTWIKSSRPEVTESGMARPSVRQVCTVNPEFVVDARRDPTFAKALQRADLRVADGAGIILAARLQGVALPGRITGSDGIYHICRRAAAEGWRIFVRGAAPGVAQRAASELQRCYPGLHIAGAYAGSPQDRDWPIIKLHLSDSRPDILLVAFGHPRQDMWIDRHRSELPATVAIGVGGAFDFVAGVTRRAPPCIRRLGLEWMHRLAREPWRWRRMSKLPVFAAQAVGQALQFRR